MAKMRSDEMMTLFDEAIKSGEEKVLLDMLLAEVITQAHELRDSDKSSDQLDDCPVSLSTVACHTAIMALAILEATTMYVKKELGTCELVVDVVIPIKVMLESLEKAMGLVSPK